MKQKIRKYLPLFTGRDIGASIGFFCLVKNYVRVIAYEKLFIDIQFDFSLCNTYFIQSIYMSIYISRIVKLEDLNTTDDGITCLIIII